MFALKFRVELRGGGGGGSVKAGLANICRDRAVRHGHLGLSAQKAGGPHSIKNGLCELFGLEC